MGFPYSAPRITSIDSLLIVEIFPLNEGDLLRSHFFPKGNDLNFKSPSKSGNYEARGFFGMSPNGFFFIGFPFLSSFSISRSSAEDIFF